MPIFVNHLEIAVAGLTHENLYSSKNNHYRKKSAALPAAALPFAAADRDWNRTARTFLPKSSLAIGQSGSAALPLPRVPPFLFYIMSLFCVYIFHAESLIAVAPAVYFSQYVFFAVVNNLNFFHRFRSPCLLCYTCVLQIRGAIKRFYGSAHESLQTAAF